MFQIWTLPSIRASQCYMVGGWVAGLVVLGSGILFGNLNNYRGDMIYSSIGFYSISTAHILLLLPSLAALS